MAKSMGEKLKKEIQADPTVQDLTSRMKTLEQEAAKKREGIEKIRQQAEDKKAEAQKLRQEAENKLRQGEDPLELLSKASDLEQEAESIEQIMPGAQSKPDSREQSEIQRLQKELNSQIRRIINESETKQQVQKEVVNKIEDLKETLENWENTARATSNDFGSRETGSGFTLDDKILSRFCSDGLKKHISDVG